MKTTVKEVFYTDIYSFYEYYILHLTIIQLFCVLSSGTIISRGGGGLRNKILTLVGGKGII